MGRLQSDEVTPQIVDWAGDGVPTSAQDVNFDGHKDGQFAGSQWSAGR